MGRRIVGAALKVAATACLLSLPRCAGFGTTDTSGPDAGVDAGSGDAAPDVAPPADSGPGGDGAPASPCDGGGHRFCVDFDEGQTPDLLFTMTTGDLFVDDAEAVSQPASLRTRTTGAPGTVTEVLDVPASGVHVAFDFKIDRYDNEALVNVFSVVVAAPSTTVALALAISPTGASFYNTTTQPDGAVTNDALDVTTVLGPIGAWSHVSLDVLLSGASPRFVLSRDGVTVASSVVDSFTATKVTVSVGAFGGQPAADAGISIEHHFDNLTVDLDP